MEPLDSDTPFTLELLDLAARVDRVQAFLSERRSFDSRDKRSAMATLRNRARQIAGALEAAVEASRVVG